jgi:hypothetical protein
MQANRSGGLRWLASDSIQGKASATPAPFKK